MDQRSLSAGEFEALVRDAVKSLPREFKRAVRDTVLHEFAHYFGISDEHMARDGTY